jgi:anhydro-N-acetylmuramic acid kinase
LIVVGLSSGTSVDAIDVAVADLSLYGEVVQLRPVGHSEFPWSAELRRRLLAALPPAPVGVAEWCKLDTLVGQELARVAVSAVQDLAGGSADLVVSHGQTVFHWVSGSSGAVLGTLQIGQPAWIAEATGLPVVSDLRAADVAAGGQGAPLASTLDALWLNGSGSGARAALNLGGIANVTLVSGDGRGPASVSCWDSGPASCLLDVMASRLEPSGPGFDVDGRLAASGAVREDLLGRLLACPYFAKPAPKSTGRELFTGELVDAALAQVPPVSPGDLMATLVELTARTVGESLRANASGPVLEVVASGGGVRNPVLLEALKRHLAPAAVVRSDERGLPSDAKEVYLFALLGFLTWHGLPGVAADRDGGGVTGSRVRRVLGRISPGAQPLRLPEPAATEPLRLEVV